MLGEARFLRKKIPGYIALNNSPTYVKADTAISKQLQEQRMSKLATPRTSIMSPAKIIHEQFRSHKTLPGFKKASQKSIKNIEEICSKCKCILIYCFQNIVFNSIRSPDKKEEENEMDLSPMTRISKKVPT